MRSWILCLSLCFATAGATALIVNGIQPSRERYEIASAANGILARLDKVSGEVVFLGPTGALFGSFPAREFAPADPYAAVATPDSARNPSK